MEYGATSTPTPAPNTSSAVEEPEEEESLADVIGEEGEDFLSRFMGNSADAAAGDLLSGEQDVILTIAAGDEANYEGSVLNVYRAGSREDGVIIALESKYDADTLSNFKALQAAITSVAELRGSESFKSFTELAEALVQALLPEKTADEVDAIIVALLQSGENLGDLDVDLGDDIDGEIVGYLAQDGYELFLVLRDDVVELLVRESA